MIAWPLIAISPTSPTSVTSFHSLSISLHCTPQTGTPIEPGRGSRSGSLNVATGEVSESP